MLDEMLALALSVDLQWLVLTLEHKQVSYSTLVKSFLCLMAANVVCTG